MASSTPKVMIGTPTANGFVMADHASAVFALQARLHRAGIGAEYRTVDGPYLSLQRDILADAFLASDCTHLLLVDGNIGFPADLCERLLASGKPLVGAVAPRTPPDFRKVEAIAASRPLDQALALASEWEVQFLSSTIHIENGFCQVAAIGTGFLLVARSCLEGLDARGELPRYKAYHSDATLRGFFREPPGSRASPEQDYRLCRLWRASGGEVWVYAPAVLRRVGDFAFGLPFAAFLAALRSAGARADRNGATKQPRASAVQSARGEPS